MLVIKLSQLGSLFLFVIFMNIDNRDLKQGQTMFDYLKRKKRAALQKTLNRGAFNTSRQPLHDKSMSQFNTDFKKTRREDSQGLSSKTTNRGKSPQLQNISTRRNIIQDQDRKSNQRSFIQMISPIRSKSPAKEAQKSVSKQQNVKKDPYRENYTKKMLTQKINMTRSVIEGLSKAGRSLKQKAHLLFLDLKTVLRHIDNCEDAGIEKKTDEIKAKIRALQTIFKQFNSNDSQTNLNEFYMHFSQYLNQLEGKAKAQIQQNRGNVTQQISNAKNIQIDQLKQQKFKLQKQLSINLKKNSRLEKENEELQIHIQNLQEKWSKKYEEKSIKLQQHINSLKQENIKLKQELQGMIQTIRNLQEERKSLVHQKQKFQQQCLNTITRVKSQQQQFLLHQIVIIKKQFSNDITKMTQLFKIKQDSYIRRIEQHQNQNSKMRRYLVDSHEDCKKISQSMQAVQAQNIRLKKQNECLATDMHRINEELYQHWLALKDIKTLSQRLDIFQKFRKIYEDLLFNQQLFL